MAVDASSLINYLSGGSGLRSSAGLTSDSILRDLRKNIPDEETTLVEALKNDLLDRAAVALRLGSIS